MKKIILTAAILILTACGPCETCTTTKGISFVAPGIEKEKSFEIHKHVYSEAITGEAIRLFPGLKDDLKERVIIKVRHNKDVVSGRQGVQIGIGFVLNPGEKEHPDRIEVIDFYKNKIVEFLGVEGL